MPMIEVDKFKKSLSKIIPCAEATWLKKNWQRHLHEYDGESKLVSSFDQTGEAQYFRSGWTALDVISNKESEVEFETRFSSIFGKGFEDEAK